MTRVTSFGRKRKYLEAGFATDLTTTSEECPVTEGQDDSVQPKERPNRAKKPKADGGDDEQAPSNPNAGSGTRRLASDGGRKSSPGQKKRGLQVGMNRGARNVAISGYKQRTEQRRLKRISDRQADTVCFACRGKGHSARDCPEAGGNGPKKVTVGMCYRCGSTSHTLSRCRKPEDPHNPLPFASCFVCSRKGHLASACPQNAEKGIYPNGGSCKLCGEKTHLAKDCGLRKKDASGTAAATIFGTGSGAGADEDDFHTFKRKNAEVSKDEKNEDRRRKQLDVQGLQTQVKKKKVVFF